MTYATALNKQLLSSSTLRRTIQLPSGSPVEADADVEVDVEGAADLFVVAAAVDGIDDLFVVAAAPEG